MRWTVVCTLARGNFMRQKTAAEESYIINEKLNWSILTKEVLALSSAYGGRKNKALDQDIMGACLSKYLYDCVNDDNYCHIGYIQSKYQVDVSFNVGDTFGSFDAVITNIKAYEQAKFVQFWKHDA